MKSRQLNRTETHYTYFETEGKLGYGDDVWIIRQGQLQNDNQNHF